MKLTVPRLGLVGLASLSTTIGQSAYKPRPTPPKIKRKLIVLGAAMLGLLGTVALTTSSAQATPRALDPSMTQPVAHLGSPASGPQSGIVVGDTVTTFQLGGIQSNCGCGGCTELCAANYFKPATRQAMPSTAVAVTTGVAEPGIDHKVVVMKLLTGATSATNNSATAGIISKNAEKATLIG